MTTPNQETVMTANTTQESIKYISRPVAERRNELLPKALSNEDKIEEGKDIYQKYLEAKKLLASNPDESGAVMEVQSFNYRITPDNGLSVQKYSKIKISSDAANRSSDEIKKEEERVRGEEERMTDRISVGYGIFLAAVEASDFRTAVIVLQDYPDLVYEEKNCQQLESLVTKLFADNLPVTQITKDRWGEKTTELGFLEAMASDEQGLGTVFDIGHLLRSNNEEGTHPPGSIESINRMSQLAIIAQALSEQDKLNKDNPTYAEEKILAMNKFRDDYVRILYPDKEDQQSVITLLNKRIEMSWNLPTSWEEPAFRISQFTESEMFTKLTPEKQKEIKLKVLGHCLGITERIIDNNDPRYVNQAINRLVNIMAPMLDKDNTRVSGSANLQSLEAAIIQRIVSNIREKKYQAGQDLQTGINNAAGENERKAEAIKNEIAEKETQTKAEQARLTAEVQAKENADKEETKRQIDILEKLNEPNLSKENPLFEEVGRLRENIHIEFRNLVDKIPILKRKSGFLGLQTKEGYSKNDLEKLEKDLADLPKIQELNNQNRLWIETRRQALQMAIGTVKTNLIEG